jgi:hypothetical protein
MKSVIKLALIFVSAICQTPSAFVQDLSKSMLGIFDNRQAVEADSKIRLGIYEGCLVKMEDFESPAVFLHKTFHFGNTTNLIADLFVIKSDNNDSGVMENYRLTDTTNLCKLNRKLSANEVGVTLKSNTYSNQNCPHYMKRIGSKFIGSTSENHRCETFFLNRAVLKTSTFTVSEKGIETVSDFYEKDGTFLGKVLGRFEPQVYTGRDENWRSFVTHHMNSFKGTWALYNQDKTLMDSYFGDRKFTVCDGPDSIVCQTNSYTYNNGTKLARSWQIEKAIDNLEKGIYHPNSRRLNADAFSWYMPQGSTIFMTNTYDDKAFLCEMFFRYKDLRHSVTVFNPLPMAGGRVSSIREEINYPATFWSDELTMPTVDESNVSGNFLKQTFTMTADLKIQIQSVVTTVEKFDATYYFPDKIQLMVGDVTQDRMTVSSRWYYSDEYIQQQTVTWENKKAVSYVLDIFTKVEQ